MPRSGINGTYTLPGPQKTQVPNTPILSSVNNQGYADIEQTFNTVTPKAYGGTDSNDLSLNANDLRIKDGADTTKRVGFDVSAVTTATTRTVSIPNKNGTLAMISDLANFTMDSRPSLIVNGNFQSVFENPGSPVLTANNSYFAEQFFLSFTAATAAMSVQLLTSVRTLSGNDRVGEFKTTTTKASLGATDFVTLSTVIEGSRPEWKAAAFGTAGAKPFVYRFEFTGPAGLYHMHFQNSAGNRHCAVPFTVAAPEANVATVRTLVIPADTTGTWLFGDGDKGLVCDLVLAAGATLTGGTASTWGATARLAATTQFNILSSTSNVARIADVGLKNDQDATAVYGLFKVNETDAVYRSERYVASTYESGVNPGAATTIGMVYAGSGVAGVGAVGGGVNFPVRMSKPPSISFWDGAGGASLSSYTSASAGGAFTNGDTLVTGPFNISSRNFAIKAGNTTGRNGYIHYLALARL